MEPESLNRSRHVGHSSLFAALRSVESHRMAVTQNMNLIWLQSLGDSQLDIAISGLS